MARSRSCRAAGASLTLVTVALIAAAIQDAQPRVGNAAAAVSANSTVTSASAAALPAEWTKAFEWRNIGPANMGGRITDIAVYEKDPCIWYVATASGGLLKTANNGVTFEHQFDHEATVSIGAVAVCQSDPNLVWVGTGEANPRNSVSWGDGVYKSTDGGKTWKNMGLRECFQTGAIVIHPEDPDVVYLGSLGRLWGPNEERGLFKTTDGGETWEKILYIDDKTGIIDVQIKPDEPDTLLVAAYERQRDGFDGNDPAKKWGPGSGLYKSTDGGRTWRKITEGLPSCNLGRIGIDFYRKDPNVVFMVLESEQIGKEPENAAFFGVTGEDAQVGARLTEITKDGPADKAGLKVGDIVIAVNDATVHSYGDLLKEIRKHLAGDVANIEVSRERQSVIAEVTFTTRPEPEAQQGQGQQGQGPRGGAQARARQQANRSPFGERLGGQRENMQEQQGPDGHEYGGLFKSTDAGESWTRINSLNPRPMYFSEVRVDPSDDKYVYMLGVSLYRSKDGGITFTGDGGRNGVHVDHHALWVDPADGRHMILGNDGGVYVTHDRMDNWDHLNHMAIGQFYHVAVGPRRNYRIYGGLQDNGSWGGPSRSRDNGGPINQDWISIGGGDGFVCRVDPDDADQVYFESQNGGMGRFNLRTGERGFIRPQRERGVRYRFNWKTPFLLSSHNSRIHYAGGNYVFRSLNKGEQPKRISPEITRTNRGSATALAESPRDADVLYVGTDDGAFWVTRDGGAEWTPIVDFPLTEEEKKAQEQAEEEEGEGEPGESGESSGEPASGRSDVSSRGERGSGERGRRRGGPPGEGNRGPGMGGMLQRLDANNDGKIVKDEVPERMSRMFERLDANEDGVIDAAEIEQAGERMRSARGERSESGERPARRPSQDPDEATPSEAPTETAESEQSERQSRFSRRQQRRRSDSSEDAGETQPAQPEQSAGEAAADDPISGEWIAKAIAEGLPEGAGEFSLRLRLDPQGRITGATTSQMGEGEIVDGKFDRESRRVTFAAQAGPGAVEYSATLGDEESMAGTGEVGDGMFSFRFQAKRTSKAIAAARGDADAEAEADKYDWKALTDLLPGPRWVSSIEASRFKAGRVYVTFDGHRSNDDAPYLFVSENFGETWRPLLANLPAAIGSTRVIREDLHYENLLYLGCEFGAWVSIDRGESWTRLNNNLPTVAVHEFAIHPTAGEVVAATHGRSLWILDVTPLRALAAGRPSGGPALYQPNAAVYWRPEPRRGDDGPRAFTGSNGRDGAEIFYALAEAPQRFRLEIRTLEGERLRELEAPPEPGLHKITWDLRREPEDPPPGQQPRGRGRFGRRARLVPSGEYIVALTVDNQTLTQRLHVQTDPEYPDYRAWEMEEQELEYQRFLEELEAEEESLLDAGGGLTSGRVSM